MTDPKEQIKWLEEKIEDNGRQVEQWKDNPAFKNLVTSICTETENIEDIIFNLKRVCPVYDLCQTTKAIKEREEIK